MAEPKVKKSPQKNPKKILVLGGAASGKSLFAEGLLAGITPRVYIATAEAGDEEMQKKIAIHRARRGADWQVIEAPRALAKAIESSPPESAVLVDCMTLWLANLLAIDDSEEMESEIADMLRVFETSTKTLVLVSNETGLGIVPHAPLARQFRQRQGELNQALAVRADCVVQVIAGLPVALKGALGG